MSLPLEECLVTHTSENHDVGFVLRECSLIHLTLIPGIDKQLDGAAQGFNIVGEADRV